MRRLDDRSRQALTACIIRAAMLIACVVAAWIMGLLPSAQVCSSFSTVFTLAATMDVLTATWRREPAGRGSLNNWDEALTFNGVAMFAQLLQRLHP